MDIFTGLATYFIIWWLSLFMILPIGVRSQSEAGTVAKGSDPGAPIRHNLKKKLIWTTALALVFWLIMLFLVIATK
jgi:predicted secreted protein